MAWLTAAAAVCAVMAAALPTAGMATTTPAGDRAYELVSPPDKRGGDISASTWRTRAASDGDAIGFISLTAFGDVVGTGVATEYLSTRFADSNPGTNGWATHALTPRDVGGSFDSITGLLESLYVGDFSADFGSAVYFTKTPLTGDPNVALATNLYRRTDLRTAGGGRFELVTECPLCESTSAPLTPPATQGQGIALRPLLVGTSADFAHIAFESKQRLTDDTPAIADRARLYEWDNGQVRLVGRIPATPAIECDDSGGPACTPADVSIGGSGAGTSHVLSRTPHAVSDGSDGQSRIFFTRPTDDGTSSAPTSFEGNVYMRVGGTRTVRLNASERTSPDSFVPAKFLDAAADGTRAFFSTSEQLTEDAPAEGNKLYMYDATKPASAPDNLTLVSVDNEPGDLPGSVRGVIGVGGHGQYVYFVTNSQLVRDAPLFDITRKGIYLWNDGVLRFVGEVGVNELSVREQLSSGLNYQLEPRQARVTPDGKHVLFTALDGAALLGYDHGECVLGIGNGCREVYVYSADSGELACASCNPSRATATVSATTWVHEGVGGTNFTTHDTRAISDDGSRVFFSTAEALVAADVNGKVDAYEYDVVNRTPRLLSSGTDPSHSYFLDAGGDGRDAFFVTRERLVGWDRDGAYDLYDARVGGGFPEPPPAPSVCSGDACQGTGNLPPALAAPVSELFSGAGNVSDKVVQRATARRRCRRGFVKNRVRGRLRCVRGRRRRSSRSAKRAHKTERRGS
jgi:hypothetical protein